MEDNSIGYVVIQTSEHPVYPAYSVLQPNYNIVILVDNPDYTICRPKSWHCLYTITLSIKKQSTIVDIAYNRVYTLDYAIYFKPKSWPVWTYRLRYIL